ncbi:MAG: polysaccharide biosynthesis protein PslH, partial [Frankiaceae bacterium]|nr:polysaccharide biosynthesis protein PslH [Frankiaceae bacterium]
IAAAVLLVRDVLPRVQAEIPTARLLLVGRNPGPAVRALVGPAVELRADVADARAELADMTVYVAPLVSGWGIKNKVLEAMAAGRAVVTTPAGSAGIGAGDGVVEAVDAADVAAAVIALLRDRPRLLATGAAARRRVTADFTWERSSGRIEQLWADVAAGPEGRRR